MCSKVFPTLITQARARLLKHVLFDQNVPRPLRRFLLACDVKVADEMGWSRTQNGLLLDAAEQAEFDVVLSGDQTIKYEQNMTGRRSVWSRCQIIIGRL
jgi:hypothetical protein